MQTRTLAILAILVPGLAARSQAENWPQWRGPSFNGSTIASNLPAEGIDSNHVLWRAPLPGPSAATPSVWDNRVFVSAADKSAKEVLAIGLNAGNGQELWRHALSADHSAPMNNDMASPSPVTDGERVCFLTGNGALAAFSLVGAPLWQRDLAKDYGTFVINFGYSSSPLLYDGKLYVLALQNEDPHQHGLNPERQGSLDSYLLAIDPATGRTLWKLVRATDVTDQSRESYVTPYPMIWNGRREILLAGGDSITGHDPDSGAEIWRWWFAPADHQKLQHVVPTPVAGDGLVFVLRPEHRPLFALRAGGTGVVGDDYVAWSLATNQSWIASPLLYRERLYVLQEEQKALVCLEAKTGRVIWDHKLPAKGPLYGSPTAADGKIFLLSFTGEVMVLVAGDDYRELGYLHLEESGCRSTIAVANNQLFVRTGKNLYCLGAKAMANISSGATNETH